MDPKLDPLLLEAINQRVEIQPYDPAWPGRFALERAVEIDHMQPREFLRGEFHCPRGRIALQQGSRIAHIAAAGEPGNGAGFEVDGGVEDQAAAGVWGSGVRGLP